jgi:hypothetical protein
VEKRPTLWRALPAIEELQLAWEKKHDNPRFNRFHDVINKGLVKVNKYYSRFDEKLLFILALGKFTYLLYTGLTNASLMWQLFILITN